MNHGQRLDQISRGALPKDGSQLRCQTLDRLSILIPHNIRKSIPFISNITCYHCHLSRRGKVSINKEVERREDPGVVGIVFRQHCVIGILPLDLGKLRGLTAAVFDWQKPNRITLLEALHIRTGFHNPSGSFMT